MPEPAERRNWLGPYVPAGNLLRDLIQQLRLAYALLWDRRVPAWTKLIPVAALAYLLLPLDVIPDFAPVLGQLDDLAVVMLGLRTFLDLAPPAVVHEHLLALAAPAARAPAPAADSGPARPDEDVVDGTVISRQ